MRDDTSGHHLTEVPVRERLTAGGNAAPGRAGKLSVDLDAGTVSLDGEHIR